MVPTLSIVFIIFNMVVGIALPVGFLLFFKKKYNVSVKAFFTGVIVMVVFALVLERIVHAFALGNNPVGRTINGNFWLYALYGGTMAGLFEETGRFLAMKFFLKDKHDDPNNALMYGAGHGGIEAFLIGTVGMINALVYSLFINSGLTDSLLAPLDSTNRVILSSAFDTLINSSPWSFPVAGIERIGAFIAQLGLSLIVWYAAKEGGQIKYYFIAIVLHMLLDAVSVILSKLGVPVMLVEVFVFAFAIGTFIYAKKLKDKKSQTE